jgi:hypothetical protein
VRVDIIISDVNDNAPVFSQSVYNVDVDIGFRGDTTLLVVTATDRDAGHNADIRYSLAPTTNSFFTVRLPTYLLPYLLTSLLTYFLTYFLTVILHAVSW